MKKLPEWVPEEVIAYSRQRCEHNGYIGEHDQRGIEALCRAIESESEDMRKAWRAIAKRSEVVRPRLFAELITSVVCTAEKIQSQPLREQIETFRNLTSKVQALCPEFEKAFGQWPDSVLLERFADRPHTTIHELADKMDRFTQMFENTYQLFTDRTGKPGSKNAKRTFVIRLLSEQIGKNYGTPLHETVAATVSVIFDEYVDPDTVRKIVAYSRTP